MGISPHLAAFYHTGFFFKEVTHSTMAEMTRQQLADVRGCTAGYVTKRKLPKLKNGNYDLTDEQVRDFIVEPYRREWERDQKIKARRGRDVDGIGDSELEDELLRENIEWKRKQSRKLDLEHEIKKKELIPVELITIWIGYFAAGIRTNFLTLGNRIARGDTSLRDRIEREVKKAIEKTISGAEMGLREDGEKIAKSLENN